MLDAQMLVSLSARQSGNVTRGEGTRHAAFEVFVHNNAAINFQTGLLGKLDSRTYSNANHDEVSL